MLFSFAGHPRVSDGVSLLFRKKRLGLTKEERNLAFLMDYLALCKKGKVEKVSVSGPSKWQSQALAGLQTPGAMAEKYNKKLQSTIATINRNRWRSCNRNKKSQATSKTSSSFCPIGSLSCRLRAQCCRSEERTRLRRKEKQKLRHTAKKTKGGRSRERERERKVD